MPNDEGPQPINSSLPAMLPTGFLASFADEKGRDAYLPHPAHQEFVDLAKPRLEKVLVVDYWVQR